MKRTISLVCLLVLFLTGCADTSSQASDQPTSIPTTQAQIQPTATATPRPTPTNTPGVSLQPTNGPTQLDQPISNFFGAYGGADVKLDNGFTWFLHDADGNRIEWVSASYRPNGTVDSVTIVNTSDTAWSTTDSFAKCFEFLPDGVRFDRWADSDNEWFSTAHGEIALTHINDMGDCMVKYFG